MSVRIGIIDDHPAFVLGLSAILNAQHDLQVVAAASTARALVGERMRLDLVLLDIALSDGSSPASNLERLAALKAPVLVLAGKDLDRAPLVQQAMAAGALGAIARSESAERIVEAARRGAQGAVVLGRPNGQLLASAYLDPENFLLSERETEVLRLYAGGQTADLVAAALFISRDTVNDHIRRIRAKYAAAGRAAPTKVDLFKRAVEDGLV
ncbi:MAG: response regulator transcription factor [Microbacterium sp.]|uniref:response regulator transcription factor n=1 Tax=Microbacterium sp. TaxID=51671 RepID=UPI001ACDE741|nr:response regulator transcription factor [Microbacterium sp.]MBN9175523.1 response regulator transcription factor [Microbacterium sp.]MBN9186283.1 response regulator transcription factor [Microbacterium sp.]